MTTRARRALGAVLATGALTAAAASCGIPTDDQPRAISPSSTAGSQPNTPSTMDPNSANGVEETVFLIEGSATASSDGERLAARTVHVANTTDEAQLAKSTLEELIAQSSEDGLTNAVPSGLKILSATLNEDGTELTVDLSDDFNDVQQLLQRQAFAQIVFSATAVTPANINRVVFHIDGVPIAAATGNDTTPAAGDPVSRSDYPTFEANMASTTTEFGGS